MNKRINIIKLKFPLLIFFIAFNSCGKKVVNCNYIVDYHPYVISAEIAYEQKDYDKAYKFLKSAFDKCEPRNTTTYYEIDKMARITAHLELYDESIDMIRRQVNQGFTLNKYTNDTLFNNVLQSREGVTFINHYDSLRNNYIQSVDKNMVEKLIKMSTCDQQYRGSGQYQEKKNEQEKLDSINEKQLVNIFETYGFPAEHLIRYAYPQMIRVDAILLHTEDSIRINYFIPKLKEFVESGQCDPKTYATVYDQYLLYNGQPQIYGTYQERDGSLSNSVSLDEVEKNRISIGLPTIKQKNLIHELKIINYPDTYGRFFNKKK